MKRVKRIGIFGGSFDPPHVGHLIIAEVARQQLHLDKVVFVPAYVPPHKKGNHASTASDRLRMTKLAVRTNPHFSVSNLEMSRKGISYTVDTIWSFKRRYPSSELFLIIGADSLQQFWTWRSPREILSLASLAVYSRRGYRRPSRSKIHEAIDHISGPLLEISSTEVRNRIQKGGSIQYLVPDRVRAFINRRKLYRK
ncbi:MAG: nicotinate-nucleotide adenylyltransferase [Bacteroidota bacterium]